MGKKKRKGIKVTKPCSIQVNVLSDSESSLVSTSDTNTIFVIVKENIQLRGFSIWVSPIINEQEAQSSQVFVFIFMLETFLSNVIGLSFQFAQILRNTSQVV